MQNRGKRQLFFLENDGGIKFILLKLIFNVIECQRRNEVIYGKNFSEEYKCKIVHKATHIHKFDWIVPKLLLNAD